MILSLCFTLWSVAQADYIFNKTDLREGRLKSALSFEQLQSDITKNKYHSIEEMLAALPSDLKSNYVLVYESRSAQDASFQSPRVLLFGKDARLILTFNGDPKQKGYDAIELVHFKQDDLRFEFREIAFSDGKARLSEANPAKCLACHNRQSPRPNWDGYFFWPGLYGSEDDHIFRANNEHFRYKTGEKEEKEFGAFAEKMASHPRYKHLNRFWEKGSDYDQIVKIGDAIRPASLLSHLLGRLNQLRIAGIFQAEAKTKHDPYRILGVLTCNTHLPDKTQEYLRWLPQELRKPSAKFESALEKIRKIQDTSYQERLARHQKALGPSAPVSEKVQDLYKSKKYESNELAEYSQLLAWLSVWDPEDRLQSRNWSMEFNNQGPSLNTPGNEFGDLGFTLAPFLLTKPDDKDLLNLLEKREVKRACAILEKSVD